MKDPMLNEEFLHQLDQYPHKFLWAKIISLNKDEYPVEEITGKITSGNVTVDGTSALRRTCSLSMVTDTADVTGYYWTLKTKFRLEVGVENLINPEFPDIIWFNQGVFVVTSFSCNLAVNNFTINLQGKDKMTLLNGNLGGVIPASWDFATEDVTATDDNGNYIEDSYGRNLIQNNRIPIKDIVLQAVHEFAQEPWQNIVINDLDDYGIELLEYQGDTPLYYLIQTPESGPNSKEVWNMTTNGDMECYIVNDNGEVLKEESLTLATIEKDGKYSYEKLIEELDPSVTATDNLNVARIKLKESDKIYTVAKITRDSGTRVCGYRITDIIYPYDLIAAPGDTVTSVLDKLVQMLGNFEYFYDVDGRFIFQKKRTYLDVSYNNIINEHSISPEVWATSSMYSSKYSYTFDDHTLVSAVQNSPNLSNIKNDYSLWGKRTNGNVSIPIHMRYAIDKKPMYYKVIGHIIKRNEDGKAVDENGEELSGNNAGEFVYEDAGQVFYTEEGEKYINTLKNDPDYKDIIKKDILPESAKKVDWREIIYQMANDYRRWYRDASSTFLRKVRDNNKYTEYDSFYEHGITGYEQYYIDFEMNLSQGVVAYWRELYNLDAAGKTGNYTSTGAFTDYSDKPVWQEYEKGENGEDIYETDEEGNPIYEVDFKGDFVFDKDKNKIPKKKRKAYDSQEIVKYREDDSNPWIIYKSLKNENTKKPGLNNNYWAKVSGAFTYDENGWNVNILNNPELLNFWFDFIDTNGELSKYSVPNIGLRSKAANDDKIKAIYFREVPNVIFTVNSEKTQPDKWIKPGYCYVNIPSGLNALFTISSRGKNAMDVIEEYLYSYTYPASSVTLTTVPIYYLTPNTLIYVNDKKTGSVGEYIAQKYSIQFGLGAQMSISAVETAKRIY